MIIICCLYRLFLKCYPFFLIYFRANNARSKAHSAEIYAKQARADSIQARVSAKTADPDFRQPGMSFNELMILKIFFVFFL